jgi:hypothetical protein
VIICICNSAEYRKDTGSDRVKRFYLGAGGGEASLASQNFGYQIS